MSSLRDEIEEIMVDCYDEYEQVSAWEVAFFDGVETPFRASLPGFGGFYVRSGDDTWVFKFNPAQRLRAALGWSSTYKGEL